MTNSENRIVEIKTVQSNAIRILFEALKDILTDVNLQISNEGLKIISMDGSKQAVVNLKLEASKFEKFHCFKPIKAGVNMTSLYKIIKSVKNSDIVTFYILQDSSTKLHIEIENNAHITDHASLGIIRNRVHNREFRSRARQRAGTNLAEAGTAILPRITAILGNPVRTAGLGIRTAVFAAAAAAFAARTAIKAADRR